MLSYFKYKYGHLILYVKGSLIQLIDLTFHSLSIIFITLEWSFKYVTIFN